jgi:integrase
MKLDGKPAATIIPRLRYLKLIAKQCDITNPYEVKEVLANKDKCKWNDLTKKNFVATYTGFLKFIKKTWEQPTYKPAERLPFIPTETEIDQLIASMGTVTATLLQMLKETGMRIGEATILQWQDISFQQKIVNITPEKGSNPRILPISDKLIAMLNQLNREREHLFRQDIDGLRTTFGNQRTEAAEKLHNERLKLIHFHTFRHWKGTMEYHKTKDIKHVQYILGHKHSDSTDVYINLEQAIFLADSDEWITTVTHNETEELKAIEANFTLVRAINETTAIYKKRK